MVSEAESKAKHPAGKKRVPRVAILERLQAVVQENYWMYGATTVDTPNRVERWDLRSMLDYAVMSHGLSIANGPLSYPNFYLQRNEIMQLLMEMAEVGNYGDWRFWETEGDRTGTEIEQVIKRTLDAERQRET